MTITILSPQSKCIQNYVMESMRQEAKELGFDPFGDTAQEEFERRVTDHEQHALKNPEDDLEIMFYEQEGFS